VAAAALTAATAGGAGDRIDLEANDGSCPVDGSRSERDRARTIPLVGSATAAPASNGTPGTGGTGSLLLLGAPGNNGST
jgi:hypothetical protein